MADEKITTKETERLDKIADLLNLAFSNVFDAQLNLEMLDWGKIGPLMGMIENIKEELNKADIYICGCIEDSKNEDHG